MIITIKLFAILKQRLQCDSIEVELSDDDATVAQLRSEIANQHAEVANLMQHVLIAVNTQIANDDHPLQEGCEVAIIPPVSGG